MAQALGDLAIELRVRDYLVRQIGRGNESVEAALNPIRSSRENGELRLERGVRKESTVDGASRHPFAGG